MTIEEKLKRYAELKVEEKVLKAEIDELNPQIKEYLVTRGVDKLPTNLGTFTVSETSRWKYSEAVEKLQEKEKATGIAERLVIMMLKFTPQKETKNND